MKKSILAIFAAAIFLGCQNEENPDLMAPPETFRGVTKNYNGFTVDFNPRVDILFVVDNSGSMKEEQDLVENNINHFVEQIAKDSVIDFHIGVTSVFDTNNNAEGRNHKFVPNFANGELWPLRNPENNEALGGPRFITRQSTYPGYKAEADKLAAYVDLLRSTIPIGVQDYTEGGPQYEETFSPILNAFSKELNPGFSRDDAHAVVIAMTDAEDETPGVSPEDVANYLTRLKDNNYSTYMIIPPASRPGCGDSVEKKAPSRLIRFAELTEGKIIDLCSRDYKNHLAEIGSHIKKEVNQRVIPLENFPQANFTDLKCGGPDDNSEQFIKVTYGTQKIPCGKDGWMYIPEGPAILISPDLKLAEEKDARIHVEYVPVKLKNIENGRAKPRNQR